jgi:hypothetical protein
MQTVKARAELYSLRTWQNGEGKLSEIIFKAGAEDLEPNAELAEKKGRKLVGLLKLDYQPNSMESKDAAFACEMEATVLQKDIYPANAEEDGKRQFNVQPELELPRDIQTKLYGLVTRPFNFTFEPREVKQTKNMLEDGEAPESEDISEEDAEAAETPDSNTGG